jgi:hypothetical protein
MHCPPHGVSPAGHEQTPVRHILPLVQVLPHAPQFAESVATSTQLLKQFVKPPAQEAPQLLCEHTSPWPHTTLQPPQFAGLDAMSTQTPPHFDCVGPAHTLVQAPAMHTSPIAQALSQVPQ